MQHITPPEWEKKDKYVTHEMKTMVHSESLYDYVKRLNDEYDTLPYLWIDYFKNRINSMISKNMRWKTVFNLDYNVDTKTITITGLPTYTLDKRFKPIPPQLEYTVTKMGYKKVLVYMYGKSIIKIEFLDSITDGEDVVEYVFMQDLEYETYIKSAENGNVLTTDTPLSYDNPMCNCCMYRQGGETSDGDDTTYQSEYDDGTNLDTSVTEDYRPDTGY